MVVLAFLSWRVSSWAIHGGWPAQGPSGKTLPLHIAQVNPPDGAQLSRASSVCIDLLMQAGNGLGKNPWERARFYMDGVELTSKLRGGLLNIGEDHSPMCYEVYWSLPIGWHTAQVIYKDVKGQKFQYTWRFQVE
jgi:hypothetical protein